MTRQNYYAQRRRRARRAVDEQLVGDLVRQERQVQPRIGTRKLHWMLKASLAQAGVKIGRDRLFEVLRGQELLVERYRPDRPRTTNSYHCLPVFRNLVSQVEVRRPNEVWVADLTYLRTREGFLYLALVTDWRSRMVVGYHCGDTLEAIGCLKALDMALEGLPAGARPIHHSDRGSQYCCHDYVERLASRSLPVSMTEWDHCAENALAERMNGILKSEYALGAEFQTKQQAHRAVVQAITLYNTRRPHTALKYQVPAAVYSLVA